MYAVFDVGDCFQSTEHQGSKPCFVKLEWKETNILVLLDIFDPFRSRRHNAIQSLLQCTKYTSRGVDI